MSQFQSYEEFFRELCKEEQYPPPRVIQPWLDKKPKYLIKQSADTVDFLFQEVGTASEIRKVAAFNLGYHPLRVREVITTGPFIASVSGSAKEVPQNGMLTISVRYLPQQAGTHTGRVYIRFHNDEGTFVDLTLRGTTTGEAPIDPDPEPGTEYLAAQGVETTNTGSYYKVLGVNPSYTEQAEGYSAFFYPRLTSPVNCVNGYIDQSKRVAELPYLFIGDTARTPEELDADTWELVITPPWPVQADGSTPAFYKQDSAQTELFLNTWMPNVTAEELGIPEGTITIRVVLPGDPPSGHKVELKSSSGRVIELTYDPRYVEQEGGGGETGTLKIHALGIKMGASYAEIENHPPLIENDVGGGQIAVFFKDVANPVMARNTYDSTLAPSAACPILIIGDSTKSQEQNAAVTWTMEINPPWPPNHAGIEPALQVFDWTNLQSFMGIYFPNTPLETFEIPSGSSGLSLYLPGEYEEGHTINLKSSSGEVVEIKLNPVPVVVTP